LRTILIRILFVTRLTEKVVFNNHVDLRILRIMHQESSFCIR